jgi:tRNA nucleotidyltransferase/poly(A) polymerase
MLEEARKVLAGEEAWVAGGAVRDELLGRELVDLDIACREPEGAARAYAKASGGAPFPLSERHGAWRVALEEGRTVDFTPLPGTIEDDLSTRDFTINAIARPLAGGGPVDPFEGRRDLEERRLRALGRNVFGDDPLRLLRAVRLEDELDFRLDEETELLARDRARGRADRGGAAAPLPGRLPPARRARVARASRRLDRRPPRALGLARLPARGRLPREPEAVARLE